MISQKDLREFIRHYKEVVLDTPYGEIHICGNKKAYEELTEQGKSTFSPSEISLLSEAAQNGTLETIIKLKISIPGAKIKEIVQVENKTDEKTQNE